MRRSFPPIRSTSLAIPHRYCFRLYALDVELPFPPRTTKAELLKAKPGHNLGQAQATGLYGDP